MTNQKQYISCKAKFVESYRGVNISYIATNKGSMMFKELTGN
jgi:hypothetical protein